MKGYEYKYLSIEYASDAEKTFNELGREGWRVLCIFRPERPSDPTRAWLERLVKVTKHDWL